MQENDYKLVFQKFSFLKHTHNSGDNYFMINSKIKDLNVEEADILTLAHIASVTPILNQHESFARKPLFAIADKVSRLIKEGADLPEDVLISFLELAN